MLNYIKFNLFLNASFNETWAGNITENKKNDEVKSDSLDLSKLSPEDQEKVKELQKQFENIKLSQKFVWWMERRLKEWLIKEWDPKDKEYHEVAEKIKKLQIELQKYWAESNNISKELDKMLWQVNEEISKVSPEETQMLKKIESPDFLSMSIDRRLSYITKDNNSVEDIVSWKTKNIEFNFTFDWEFNKNLYMLTTAGQVLPKEVREVTSSWEVYERMWINWEFYSKSSNQRLLIKQWTQIEVSKIWDKKELDMMEKETQKKYNEFVEKNPEYKKPEYQNTITEIFNKWLDETEAKFILTWDYTKISNLNPENAKKILVVTKYLDNAWLLDDFNSAWEVIKKLEEIINVIKKYWEWLKYSISDKWEVKFQFNESWLPEWLDIHPDLQNFIKVWLSQIWTNEYDRWADKYFSESWFWNLNSQEVPWCAAFVNWTLKKSWFEGTHSMLAKSFLWETWSWHVWIKLWDKVLWWNQSNKVWLMSIKKEPAWFAIPTANWLEMHKEKLPLDKIPDWAILVFDRNSSNKNFA